MTKISMENVKKKSMFHTNRVQIYYLVDQKNQKELINTISIG